MPEAASQVEMPETLENWRKRLTFRSWHRGTREMDLLMGSFAEAYVPSFGEADLRIYEEILTTNDPDVYDWITGRKTAPAELHSRVLDLLLSHSFAK